MIVWVPLDDHHYVVVALYQNVNQSVTDPFAAMAFTVPWITLKVVVVVLSAATNTLQQKNEIAINTFIAAVSPSPLLSNSSACVIDSVLEHD